MKNILVRVAIFGGKIYVINYLFNDIQYPKIDAENWSATNNVVSSMPSEFYFLRICTGNSIEVDKILLPK